MQFDKEGMYPPHACKRCGRMLNADGGHPAELYAGTYTGLCYKCQNAPAIVLQTACDGAKLKEYAPHCPSWRRDRTKVHAYDDCGTCKGEGRIYVSRSDPKGGSYYRYCPDCFERYWHHPTRALLADHGGAIYKAALREYERQLKKHRIWGKAKKGEAPKEIIAEIKRKIRGEMDHKCDLHQTLWTTYNL